MTHSNELKQAAALLEEKYQDFNRFDLSGESFSTYNKYVQSVALLHIADALERLADRKDTE